MVVGGAFGCWTVGDGVGINWLPGGGVAKGDGDAPGGVAATGSVVVCGYDIFECRPFRVGSCWQGGW